MATETFVIDQYGKPTIKKDPNAILDYTFDWSEWLDAIPDTIVSANPEAVSGGIEVDSYSIVDDKLVQVWVSGGTVGQKARLLCRIVTAGGRTDDRSVFLKIVER